MKTTSPNCSACNLYAGCKNPYLRVVVDTRSETKGLNCVLVVGDYTDGPDDREGTYFYSNGRGYKTIIEPLLNGLECRYVFTTAVNCAVPKGEKPNTKQYNACLEEKLKPLILKYKPRVIVTLGSQAMKALLGEKSPKTLKTITLAGMNVEWHEEKDEVLNTLVMAIDHPSNFFNDRTDKARLEKLYKTVLGKAEQYCLNSEKRLPVEFELVDTPSRFYTLAGYPFREFAFDIENTYSEKDLDKNTMWKKNAKILSMAVTYWEPKQQVYKNFVVVGPALMDKICLEKLFKDRVAVAHNITHDAQGLYRLCGVDIFPLVKDYHDTLAMFYLSDQNRLDNGLKPLSAHYLGIYDYVDEVKRYEIEANNRIRLLRKAVTSALRERVKHLNWYREWLQVESGELTFSATKVKNLRKISTMYKSTEELEALVALLEKELKDLPQEGTADYGDIPISVLAAYNAEDTYCTLRLFREILPCLSRFDKSFNQQDPMWDATAYKLYQKAARLICYVERNTLPIDMDSLEEMNQELIAKEKEVRYNLFQHPEIKKAISAIPDIIKKQEKGRLTEEHMLKELSPTKAKFITNLCKNLNLDSFALQTKSGAWSFTSKKAIQAISNHYDEIGDADLGRVFKDFVYIGNNRQTRSKFIKNWKKYYVPEDKGFHPKYKLTKNQSLSYTSSGDDGGAQSGRLGHSNPNSAQIKKVAYLRKHFKAPPGYLFCEIDFTSLEPMLIAFITNCERLKMIFRRGLDVYLVTANDIYDLGVDLDGPDDEVRKQLEEKVGTIWRDKLKIGFLAWVYGRMKASFMRDMKITEEETDHFYAKAQEMYSEVYEWKERVIDDIKQGRLLETFFGRKRAFPVLPPIRGDKFDFKRYRKELSKAVRIAFNFEPQGGGSDICLWLVALIQEWINEEGLQNVIQIVNLVHDAAWFLIKEDQAEWAVPELQRRMEDISQLPFKMDVPLSTKADIGPTLASYMKKNKEECLPYV